MNFFAVSRGDTAITGLIPRVVRIFACVRISSNSKLYTPVPRWRLMKTPFPARSRAHKLSDTVRGPPVSISDINFRLTCLSFPIIFFYISRCALDNNITRFLALLDASRPRNRVAKIFSVRPSIAWYIIYYI